MAVNNWRIWKKVGLIKREKEVKIEEELEAVIDALKGIETRELIKKLEKMKEMAKEREIIKEGLKEENLKKQISFFDEILKEYGFLEDDIDINGLRLNKIGKELLNKAKEIKMKEVTKERKKKIEWR